MWAHHVLESRALRGFFVFVPLSRPCPQSVHNTFRAIGDTKYEIYFNVRKDANKKNTLNLFVESAYIRDEDADNEPVNFKKADKMQAWKLFLKKVRGEPMRGASWE
ncbi:hypothetical protein K5D37_11075 [Pseudomonas cichorii]|nr:hypothetical protein [Pseudomonas cichorii]